MTQKPTLYDIALWAALPMAHTSRLEGRLTMILDKTRVRRAPTRRALLLALGAGAVALVPLAMLQPMARAEAAPPSSPSPGVPMPENPSAAARHLRQIYTYIGVYRRTHGGKHPATYGPDCLVADMAAAPRRYGLPDRGAGNMEQAGRFFISPGSQTVRYFLHNRRPDGTLVGTPKRTGARDVFANTDLFVRNHPQGATGFYLVLWDDGTVGKVPARDVLAVPEYDVIGPAYMTTEGRRQGKKQMAFPGQAGLPRG